MLRGMSILDKLTQLRAKVLANRKGPDKAPDAGFGRYLEKVRHNAYKVTDEEVAALLASGHTEDEIYEATVGAALGAAAERYEAGLRALDGAKRQKP